MASCASSSAPQASCPTDIKPYFMETRNDKSKCSKVINLFAGKFEQDIGRWP